MYFGDREGASLPLGELLLHSGNSDRPWGESRLWPDHSPKKGLALSELRYLALREPYQPQKKETKPTPGGRK